MKPLAILLGLAAGFTVSDCWAQTSRELVPVPVSHPTFVTESAPPITPYQPPAETVYSPTDSCGCAVTAYSPVVPGVEVRPGIIGQPTIYVPGQPVRNFLRWLSP